MSPLLFALYISDLGGLLNSTEYGIPLRGNYVSALFFADDIVLITKTPANMRNLLGLVTEYTDKWKLKISLKKSKMMSDGVERFQWSVTTSNAAVESKMETVDVFKYLGFMVELGPWKFVQEFNKNAISIARNYMYNVLSLTKDGPDRSDLAYALWSNCAIRYTVHSLRV